MKGALFFITGIILFLYGMLKLSNEVQQRFSNVRLREYFRFAVRNPVYGLITGVLSTIFFQSSTATSVLTVGVVSAGLMSFYRSLGIILGADVGTTFTVQLVVWKITDAAPLIIAFAGVLWVLGKGKWKFIGEGAFYFGLIFFGLSLVSDAAAPLKNNPTFVRYLLLAGDPFTGLVVGLVFASIVHSSAVPISILVVLAQHHLIALDNALPAVFGANIGTAVTAILAAFVANVNGKRCALSHFLFKLFGAVICIALLPYFSGVLRMLTADIAQQIAYGHLLFNIVIAAVFIFLLKPFSYLVEYILPGKAEALPLWPEYLDERLLPDPREALECVRKELHRELVVAKTMSSRSFSLVRDFKEGQRRDVVYMELVVDNLRKEVGAYLWKISAGSLSPELSQRLFTYSAMSDDVERIADHAAKIVDLARQKYKRKVRFTHWGHAEFEEIGRLVIENIEDAISLIERRDDEKVGRIIAREDEVDLKIKESRERHLERFHKRICEAEAGPIFIEMLINLERISDHCQNIAEYIRDESQGRRLQAQDIKSR
ncbi:MAG: Na/Pi cotransporter family protein [Syntrophales bacterium]